jgi:hypothetical protein
MWIACFPPEELSLACLVVFLCQHCKYSLDLLMLDYFKQGFAFFACNFGMTLVRVLSSELAHILAIKSAHVLSRCTLGKSDE